MKITHLLFFFLTVTATTTIPAQQDSSKVSLRFMGSVNNSFIQLREPTVGWGVGGGIDFQLSVSKYINVNLEYNDIRLFAHTPPNLGQYYRMRMLQFTLPIVLGYRIKQDRIYFTFGGFLETTVGNDQLKPYTPQVDEIVYFDYDGVQLGAGINVGLDFFTPLFGKYLFFRPEIRAGSQSYYLRICSGVRL